MRLDVDFLETSIIRTIRVFKVILIIPYVKKYTNIHYPFGLGMYSFRNVLC